MMRAGYVCLLLLLVPQALMAEESMGRLFMTPAERVNLDYIRQNSRPPDRIIKPEPQAVPDGEADTKALPPSSVTVQGYVKRSDGKGTVWLNHQPLRETSSQGEIQVGKVGTTDGKVRLKLGGATKEITLKAGQTYDPASGAVVNHVRDLPRSVAVPETSVPAGSKPPAPPAPGTEPPPKP